MLHLYVRLYAYTYKVRVKNAKVGNKMKPKVVELLPFIATFESKVYQTLRMNTRVSKA